jgi:hypothetical protein
MKEQKFNKMRQDPFNKNWVSTATVMITKDDADTLNSTTNFSKIKYELKTEDFNVDDATVKELISYAEENEIDVTECKVKQDYVNQINENI